MIRVIVIDGGSKLELVNEIKKNLRQFDILVSEKDKGIFDALNKGLDKADRPYLYWLGSDDFVSLDFDFTSTLQKFEQHPELDCICYRTVFFDRFLLTRSLYVNNPTLANYRIGFHLPHFSTVWKRSTLGDIRFDLTYTISADYDYFFSIFRQKKPKVQSESAIMVFMQEGGNSTRGLKQRLKGFKDVYRIHLKHTSSWPLTILAIFNRYFFKIINKIFGAKIRDVSVIDQLTQMIRKPDNFHG